MGSAQTTNAFTDACEQVIHEGFGIAPFPEGEQLPSLLEQFEQFLERHVGQPYFENLGWIPDGEDAVDNGIYCKGRPGNLDFKAMCHVKIGVLDTLVQMRKRSWSEKDRSFFRDSEDFFRVTRSRTESFLAALDTTKHFSVEFLPLVKKAQRSPQPYAHTTLRLLRYQAQDKPAGAGVHPDRSCWTGHLGGLGGGLFATNRLDGEPQTTIDVELGEIAFFPGVKAEVVSQQAVDYDSSCGAVAKTLLHGSLTNPGEARAAAVMFMHCHTNPPVVHARDRFKSLRHAQRH